MNKPNLFKYATKELSQDAFICWLLDWAHDEYKAQDENLHNLGVFFLKSLMAKRGLESKKINSFQILRQHKKIDVLVLINTTLGAVDKSKKPPADSLAIIIEDKVGAGLTNNQLERYYETVLKMRFNENQIVPIYFRTKDKLDLSAIHKYGYKSYMRNEFLSLLSTFSVDNDILKDFKDFWQKVEDDTNSYENEVVGNWNNQAWIGFYKALRQDLGEGTNGLSNKRNQNSSPTFGPLFVQEKQDYKLYIRLCEKRINFTVEVGNKDNERRKLIRKKWLSGSILVGRDVSGLGEIQRAKRVDVGKEMTIGYIENYVNEENGKVNIDKTLANLKNVEQFLKSLDVEI